MKSPIAFVIFKVYEDITKCEILKEVDVEQEVVLDCIHNSIHKILEEENLNFSGKYTF